jgi:hypothetical protein
MLLAGALAAVRFDGVAEKPPLGATGAPSVVTLLKASCTIAIPIKPMSHSITKANTPLSLPEVTFSTPSAYFQYHHSPPTKGISQIQAVGISAPRLFISVFVVISQYQP